MSADKDELPEPVWEPDLTALEPEQKALFDALYEADDRLAQMYLGALIVKQDRRNPERLAYAGHGIRELMEKLPTYLDVPVRTRPGALRPRVRDLTERWDKSKYATSCHEEGTWEGEIDGQLRNLLKRFDKFFELFKRDYPRKREETSATLKHVDAAKRRLPDWLVREETKRWEELRGFFARVGHHSGAKEEVFDSKLAELEVILLRLLRPMAFREQDVIDKIVEEGESRA